MFVDAQGVLMLEDKQEDTVGQSVAQYFVVCMWYLLFVVIISISTYQERCM